MKKNEKTTQHPPRKALQRNPPRQLFEVLFIMPMNALRIVCSSLSHFLCLPFLCIFFSLYPFFCLFPFLPFLHLLSSKKYLTPGTQYMSRLLSEQNRRRPHKVPQFYSRPHTFTFSFFTFIFKLRLLFYYGHFRQIPNG